MNVAQVITEFSPFGAERVAYDLAGALADAGEASLVIAVRRFHDRAAEAEMISRLHLRGVQTLRLLGSSTSSRPLFLVAALRLASASARRELTLLHSHTDIPDFVTALARPVVAADVWRTLHNTKIWPGRRVVPALIERLLRPEMEIAVSEDVALAWAPYMHRVRIRGRRRPELIENSVDGARIGFLPPDEAKGILELDGARINLLFVGRLVEQKGFDLLLEAVGSPEWPANVRLNVLGDGPLREQLLQSQSDRLCYLGFRTDAARYMKAFDALIMPSRFEGSPMVLQEAIAANVPVLASSCDGMVEPLGKTYPLLMGSPTTSSIIEVIRRFLSLPERRVAYPQQGGDMARRYVDLYRQAHG